MADILVEIIEIPLYEGDSNLKSKIALVHF